MSVHYRSSYIISMAVAMFFYFATGCTDHALPDSDDSATLRILEQAEHDYQLGEYVECMRGIHSILGDSVDNTRRHTAATLARAYKVLGNIHLIHQDMDAAERYYQTSLEYAGMLTDKEEKMRVLHNLTLTYCNKKDSVNAYGYLHRVRAERDVPEGLRKYYSVLDSAYCELQFGDRTRIPRLMREAIDVADRYHLDPSLKCTPTGEISSYLLSEGRPEEALEVLQEFEQQLTRFNAPPALLVGCMREYMNVYTAMGDTDKAALYQQRYFTVNDSLLNQSRFLRARNMFDTSFENHSEARLENMRSALSMHQAIVIIVLVLIAAGAMIYYRYRLRRSYRMLYHRNAQLAESAGSGTQAHSQKSDILTPERQDELFARIRRSVSDPHNFTDPHFTLEALARKLETNTKYVSQTVNQCASMNFRTFLNEQRVKEARRIITHPECSRELAIRDLATQVGFLSQSAFIAAFKKSTGMTPSLYLKMARSEKTLKDK